MNILGKLHKKLIVGVLLCALFLIGGIFAFTQYDSYKQNQKEKIIQEDKKKYNAALKQSNIQYGLQNYPAAIKPLETYMKTAVSEENKVIAYMKIASIHEGNKDYKKALAMYREAEKYPQKSEVGLVYGIARMEMRLKNYPEAIKYYQKLIEYAKKSKSPYAVNDVRDYENAIAYMEKNL